MPEARGDAKVKATKAISKWTLFKNMVYKSTV
jgi:hypothetical protein